MEFNERHDLRGGLPCWQDADEDACPRDPLPTACDITIIGAGVMGAMIAARLASDGHKVAVVDRRAPAMGSTAASTALVMWAADVPLTRLAGRIGIDAAAAAWRRVHRAVQGLDRIVGPDGRTCGWRPNPELYLAGSLLDVADLQAEGAARQAAGLPSTFIDGASVAERFALPDRAALLSDDTYAVDPIALTLLMLRRARAAGTTISFPAEVTALDQNDGGIALRFADGRSLQTGRVIIATGYEAARWYLPPAFSLGSSYAIATAPGEVPSWAEKALIWEAADPYLYARTTTDGRIIIGGEDEDLIDAQARDRLIGAKRGTLEAKGAALLGLDTLTADCAWSATFGRSPDGLPAIGRARNAEHIWLAAGFGGNGISFAALGAELIAADIAGEPDADAGLFDPYRFDSISPSS